VVSSISAFRRQHIGLGPAAIARDVDAPCRQLISEVAQTIAAQPVRYLQNFAGQTEHFLFETVTGGLILLPGVAFCLRRFQPLVHQLSRNGWVRQIKAIGQNAALLGDTYNLEAFLFETPRQTLVQIGAGLRRLSNNRCFYCGERVGDADVDHFVPFSLYPRDLMHNFVLAHQGCNRSKSDTLAALPHLERWREFLDHHDDELREIGAAVGRPADLGSSLAVARWGYGNGLNGGEYAPTSLSLGCFFCVFAAAAATLASVPPRKYTRHPRSSASRNKRGTRSDPVTRSGNGLPSFRDAHTSGIPSQSTACASNRIRRSSTSSDACTTKSTFAVAR
jgi:hypothetical protein